MDAARGERRVILWDDDAGQPCHIRADALAVGTLEVVVKLGVEVGRELVNQFDDVEARREWRAA
eukprot:scaffold243383_cov27-Tisochrysis_lutea.AAC.5